MGKWSPMSKIELIEEIQNSETEFNGELRNFWKLIKIEPQKWQEQEFGDEGEGFWVVAICGKRVIWYNDIEEGFNVSNYREFGKIESYHCNQDELNRSVNRLYNLIKFNGDIDGQASTKKNL